jgi:hypothetical protein
MGSGKSRIGLCPIHLRSGRVPLIEAVGLVRRGVTDHGGFTPP